MAITHRTSKENRIGGYRVVAPIARGGTSGVYLAEDCLTGKQVALKVLDPFFCENVEIAERLLAEREISERVRHPGLLEVLHAGRSENGVPYIAMEYLKGESLEALAGRGALDRDTIAWIGAQVAVAMGALHGAGLVHCDVKPANVFVLSGSDFDERQRIAGWGGARPRGIDGWPRIKLIDYGVVRRLDEPPPGDISIAGTPAYMAPEQWRSEPVPASDVYSLGCMLYELVTGVPVFSGALPHLMAAHRHRMPVRPSVHRPGMCPDLERVIVRALAKDPALRPSTTELEHALSRTLCAVPLAAAS